MERKRLTATLAPVGMPAGWSYFRARDYVYAGQTFRGHFYAVCPFRVTANPQYDATLTAETYGALCAAVNVQHAALVRDGLVPA